MDQGVTGRSADGVSPRRPWLVAVSLLVPLLFLSVGAEQSAATAKARAVLAVRVSGLPAMQRPAVVVVGPQGFRRVVLRSGVTRIRVPAPGRYRVVVRPVRILRTDGAARSGAIATPLRRVVAVRVRPAQAASVLAVYAAIVNPRVIRLPNDLVSVVGNPVRPRQLVYLDRQGLPGVGAVLTAAPQRLLPQGLVAEVTASRQVGHRRVLTVRSVPVTDAVPELSYSGNIQMTVAPGGTSEIGEPIPEPTGAASAATWPRKSSCRPPQLVKFGAKLNSVEVRQAFLGAWPPQMKLTLAVRTTESLGIGLAATGINCDWDFGEIGPFQGAIPVGPIVIPVYATFPVGAGIHIQGTLQAGTINIASTHVVHVAAGFDESAASMSEQGTNVWINGVLKLDGTAKLYASIGAQFGVGIAKGANVHVQAGFGPEFDWTSGQGCEVHINLGSLSAGVKVLGKSLNTPSFTPFKWTLWHGCNPGDGGGAGSGGSGGTGPGGTGGTGSGGSGGGGPGSGGTGGTGSGGSGGGSTRGGPATTISADWNHSCAVLAAGGIDCWGYNGDGELGNGTNKGSSTPVAVSGISDATAVVGSDTTCALRSTGGIDCWGYNGDGQLGNGTTTDSSTPVAVSGISDATGIATGDDHSCAVLSTGGVDCWGPNSEGGLGDGNINGSSTPVPVSRLSNATAVAAGLFHSCALLSTGGIDCWGDNQYGELGDGTTTESSTPVPVSGISDAIAIAASGYDSCALLSTHKVDCWGENNHGQLGDGTSTDSSTPVVVSGIGNATGVAVGWEHSCALLVTGGAACWGSNDYGQLGDGKTTDSSTPLAVSGISTATAISSGGLHSCALLSNGGVDCWGYNSDGELGNGAYGGSSIPVAVSGLP